MTTTPAFRHFMVLAIVFVEAILLILLSRGYEQWSGLAFGFAIAMAVMAPLMFVAEFRQYRRKSLQE